MPATLAGMEMDDLSKELLSTLRKAYELATSEIHDIQSSNERLVSFGLTAVAAGVGYGLVSSRNEVFFVLPVLLISVYSFAILNQHNIAFIGGYKRFLESRINELCADNAMLWEHIVYCRPRWHIINVPLISAYVLILFGVVGISLKSVVSASGPFVGGAFGVIVVVFCVLLIPGLRHWFTASARAYRLAEAIHRELATTGGRFKHAAPFVREMSDR